MSLSSKEMRGLIDLYGVTRDASVSLNKLEKIGRVLLVPYGEVAPNFSIELDDLWVAEDYYLETKYLIDYINERNCSLAIVDPKLNVVLESSDVKIIDLAQHQSNIRIVQACGRDVGGRALQTALLALDSCMFIEDSFDEDEISYLAESDFISFKPCLFDVERSECYEVQEYYRDKPDIAAYIESLAGSRAVLVDEDDGIIAACSGFSLVYEEGS